MKTLLTIFHLFFNSFVFAQNEVTAYHAQGKSYYPITVSVSDAESHKPLAKATVRMKLDKRLLLSASYEPNKLKEPNKTIDKNFYNKQTTNKLGLASLFYVASWSDHNGRAIFVYRRGEVIVEAEGYQTSKINLVKLKTNKAFSHSDVTHLQIELKPIKSQ